MFKKLIIIAISMLFFTSINYDSFSLENVSDNTYVSKKKKKRKGRKKEVFVESSEKSEPATEVTVENKDENVNNEVKPLNPVTFYVLTLIEKNIASVGDGLKVVSYIVDKNKVNEPINDIRNFLVSKNIITLNETTNLEEPITKGTLAEMIMKAKNWKGGFWYSIFGGSRYAYKELEFKGIFPKGGTSCQKLTGKELLGIIARIDD